jgi:putative ABC transport system permease protein
MATALRLSDWLRDLRVGFRSLVRRPTVLATVVLTSALGIAAATATFTLVYGIWFKPLPYAEADRLVIVTDRTGAIQSRPSLPEIDDYRTGTPALAGLLGFINDSAFASVNGDRLRVVAYRVAPSLFDLLGVRPALGRLFGAPEVNTPPTTVILSDAFWRTRLNADPDVIGQPLMLTDRRFTIVGVMPRDFRFPELQESEVWLPLGRDDDRTARAYSAIGRLKAGVTLEQANAELAAVADHLARQYPRTNAGWTAEATSLLDQTFGRYRSALTAFLALVGLFFGVACLNVGALLLTRQAERETELGLRAALGATRWHLTRESLLEGLLLAGLGGILGLGLSAAAIRLLVATLPTSVPRLADIGVGLVAVQSAGLLATIMGVWYGLMPSVLLGRVAGAATLRAARVATGAGRLVGGGLILVELVLSVVLLVGAAMMVHSLHTLLTEDRGFQSDGRLTLQVTLPFPRPKYFDPPGRVMAYRELADRLRQIPGVSRVGVSTGLPGLAGSLGVAVFHEPGTAQDSKFRTSLQATSPDFFDAMGIPLVSGRLFTAYDTATADRVALVNRTLASRLWPGERAIGRRIDLADASPFVPADQPFEVVGIVGDTRVGSDADPEAYVPILASAGLWTRIVLRTDGDPAALTSAVRAAVKATDAEITIEHVDPMDRVVARNFALERAQRDLASFVAVLAALLSAVGIYGSLSYAVSRRTREFGIRLALGAPSRHLVALVVRRVLVVAVAALLLGVLAALAVVRLLRSDVFGLASPDPTAIGVVSALVLVVAVVGASGPARRALRTDPLTAMRHE